MKKRKVAGLAAVAILSALYLANASWLASPPSGHPVRVAHRGVHQVYERQGVDDRTCTARHILAPSHGYIDNTLPSIAAAFGAGADVVEVDARMTRDRQFVLFHDLTLDCRTNGSGLVSSHTLGQLKVLDVGYGYTADGGKSFPLRGKGVGLMPSLEEALKAHPRSRFLIQVKDEGAEAGDLLLAYLGERGLDDWKRLAFFGSSRPLLQIAATIPEARTWSAGRAARCLGGYIALGGIGYVPTACDDGIVIVPVTQAGLLWGWPNRFLQRMRAHGTEVMMIGRIDGLSGANFSRLDSIEELDRLPPGFDGSIWTDRIELIGPRARGASAAGAAAR